MTEDTRNHWKMSNLGRISPSGIRRIAADPRYKGEAVIATDCLCSTIRATDGGGATICPLW